MNLGQVWEKLVDCICRPPRDVYEVAELLGGAGGRFSIGRQLCVREDLSLTNAAGQQLECSHFRPAEVPEQEPLPIVVYCHCNSGSRRDAEEAALVLLPHHVSVFALDFAGSGRSEGEWVTLGAHEVGDLAAAVAHLRAAQPRAAIGLWGRSMGAVTALLYSQRDPSIAGVVLDSPFSRLRDLMVELAEEQKLPIPRAFMRMALSMIKRSVRRRAGFNIDDVSPLDAAPQAFIPALFGHAERDSFIGLHHSQRLFAAYAGDKNLITFGGDHNSHRAPFFYASAVTFLHSALQCRTPLPRGEPLVNPAAHLHTRNLADPAGFHAAAGGDLPRQLSVPWVRGDEWAGSLEEFEEAWAAEVARGAVLEAEAGAAGRG
ncbi:hypothetical protein WJX81_000753 [Elliptochloris bilobata]|uniref:Serine aminopeptidase S33 domain-containing protein n=1 Tax=Elliptochloris bilobata TaxID=381761 RepID=A0AAW1RUW8_9CHLO